MKIVTGIDDMIKLSRTFRAAGKKVGLVPTMGALHDGHLSLLSIARQKADCTVLSIFVNPTQFAPGEDFQKYPRPFDEDCRKAQEAGCDVIFAPAAGAMYPEHYSTTVAVDEITGKLCGRSRPTHFQGVTTVVLKLFNIVSPNLAVFGAKDAQQVIVIKRMAADLHCPVQIVAGPIVRERDGLALSSRNVYLSPDERTAAPLLGRGLQSAEALFINGERDTRLLAAAIRAVYEQSPLLQPEYIEIVDLKSLEPLQTVTSSALVAVACRMRNSKTRLIDNIVLGGSL